MSVTETEDVVSVETHVDHKQPRVTSFCPNGTRPTLYGVGREGLVEERIRPTSALTQSPSNVQITKLETRD